MVNLKYCGKFHISDFILAFQGQTYQGICFKAIFHINILIHKDNKESIYSF